MLVEQKRFRVKKQTRAAEFDAVKVRGRDRARPKTCDGNPEIADQLSAARVEADVSPQLIGPLHRERFRSNESELIKSAVRSIQKHGHVHCLSLVINPTPSYPHADT